MVATAGIAHRPTSARTVRHPRTAPTTTRPSIVRVGARTRTGGSEPSRTVPSPDPDDPTLVARLVDGDQRALGTIYGRHAGAVLGLARQILHDQGKAEEVAQTVFLRLWEQPHRFDPERGTLKSFLLTMAHTRAIDLLRSEQARRRREEKDHRRGEPLSTPDEIGGWLQTARAEVRDALAQLPEQERRALVAAYYGGYTYKQVAELLGQPEGTVKSRIRVGLERLRELLGEEGGPG